MNDSQITPIGPGHRIQLPADWAGAMGLQGFATLERKADGILVRPCKPATWDDIFANKLVIGAATQAKELEDLTTDDLIF